MSPLWTGLLIAGEVLVHFALGVLTVWLVVSRRWESLAEWLDPFPLKESRFAKVCLVGCWWMVLAIYLTSRLARKFTTHAAGRQASIR